MAGKGGYQRPNKPAAVSGPGAMSQRTDGGPSVDNAKQAARYVSGGSYGEGQEMMDIQQGAPMAEAPGIPRRPVVGLSAPTQRPDEPVTAGSLIGPGPGPGSAEALVAEVQEPDLVAAAIRAAYRQYPSPYLRNMIMRLEAEGR